jgi:hypothetical protein
MSGTKEVPSLNAKRPTFFSIAHTNAVSDPALAPAAKAVAQTQ